MKTREADHCGMTPAAAGQADTRQQLALLRLALDQIGDAFYLIDRDARLLHVNAQACSMLGYSFDDLSSMTVFDIDTGVSPERWREHWQEMLSLKTQTLTSHNKRKDGRVVPVELKLSCLTWEGETYNLALARDISERQHREKELCRRVQEFHALVENSPDTIARYDPAGYRIYANPAFARLAGVPAEALLGKKPSDYAQTAETQVYELALHSVIDSGRRSELDYTWPAGDGRMICSHIIMTPEFGPDGDVTSVLAIGRDVSAIKETEHRLRQAEAMAQLGHWQWDHVEKKAVVSGEMCRIFGQAADWQPAIEDLLAMSIDEDRKRVLKALEDAYERSDDEVTIGYRIKNGGRVHHLQTHLHIEYGPDLTPRRLNGTTQDISELKSYESRLHEMAFHDTLTGLPNRALLNDRLNHALDKAGRRNQVLGLLVIDIDRFKEVNDTHGHNQGDLLLHESAERLRRQMRDYDTVARLGGDEFAIVLPEIRDAADLGSISRKILDALAHPFHLANQEVFISASIGIAVFPADGTTATELLQYADSALYDAKARGRAGFRFYSAELTAKARERAMLETALRRAEVENELEVFYQPKIDLRNSRLVGGEALLRWRHPSLGLVQPDKFIGIAEDTGLIVGIGAWVLKQACFAARRWNKAGECELKIAVNLSSRQFRDNDLVATVEQALAASGCQPGWLEFEITESLLLDNDESIGRTLNAFRAMGISIAIDDFGTGYSSLAYLKRFPINVLKIDRSFIKDVMLDNDSTELVKGIITMALSLRLELVAEGIETQIQEEFLQAHGCHLGQGYRYGKPMPADEFAAMPLMQERYSLPFSCDGIRSSPWVDSVAAP
ncbi:bifunctional diguanylate cyclase/phosphodiesterase [Dechloromonas denitrificans]|uniref:sensor domain-containing protein n=1 Tax=Dechloromonas denitrificans TaxID=281362 RepID=UPI001CF982B1|nr:bifunctional diguanylate cyclase/phosphodiesterase [Dechloromonas denitrificans]UCV09364.1 EAL domain-containing protein [Dechloromonas denitrificans]